jgi:hypothetical protein
LDRRSIRRQGSAQRDAHRSSGHRCDGLRVDAGANHDDDIDHDEYHDNAHTHDHFDDPCADDVDNDRIGQRASTSATTTLPAQVLGTQTTNTQLSFTGTDVERSIAIGAFCLFCGVVFVRARPRRPSK